MSGSDENMKSAGKAAEQEADMAKNRVDGPDEQPEPDVQSASDAKSQEESGGPDRIAALEAEVADLRDQALRARAEVENVLRRTAREKQDASAYAVSGFARDLLAVSDNLRRALDALPDEARADSKVKAFFDGVEMTERELLNTFERHGIRKIDPRGEKFDHNFHQAMAEVEVEGHAPGTVVDVYQAGYVLRERLLRPAMVTVAKNNTEKPAERVDSSV
jgi:molecular chaperone GrpE